MERPLTELRQARDVTSHVLVLVANCVEDWYPDARPMPEPEFIDRLCEDYLNPEGLEIEDLGSPAVRKIMSHARRVKQAMA